MTKDEKKQSSTNATKKDTEKAKKDPVDDPSNSSSLLNELRKVTLELIESRAEGKTC